MIKIFTTKKNRFGKSIVIKGQPIQIDATGNAQVSEDLVAEALLIDFELVDKSVKFASEEEQKHIEEINEVLESAKKKADEIISEAEKKAAEIISEAEKEAGIIREENHVDEKAEKKAELEAKKIEELKALCIDSGIPEDQYKGLKKAQLVDLLMSFIFED